MSAISIRPNADVYVFGDTITDRLSVVKYDRFSQEDPYAVVAKQVRYSEFYGGAANVAANLLALGVNAQLVSLRGEKERGQVDMRHVDPTYYRIAERLTDESYFVPTAGGRPCIEVKHRTLGEDGRYLLRVDTVPDLPAEAAANFWQTAGIGWAELRKMQRSPAVCVVADYGKGFVSSDFWSLLQAVCVANGSPLLADLADLEYATHSPVTLTVKMNLAAALKLCVGASLAERPRDCSPGTVRDWLCVLANAVRKQLDAQNIACRYVVVTCGVYGIALASCRHDDEDGLVTGFCRSVDDPAVDVCGAGDVVLAVLADTLRREPYNWKGMQRAICRADCAARIAVQRIGTCVVIRKDLGE